MQASAKRASDLAQRGSDGLADGPGELGWARGGAQSGKQIGAGGSAGAKGGDIITELRVTACGCVKLV